MARTRTTVGRPGLPCADDPGMEQVARALFERNAGDYAEPAMLELAWLDEGVRGYWRDQAEAVRADLEDLARHGRVGAGPDLS